MRTRERRLAGVAPRTPLAVVGVMMIVLLAAGFTAAAPSPAPGQPAPGFSGTDSSGRPVSLSLADYRGSIVVLEWTNHDCPFVRRHYDTGNMQALQRQAKKDGVVWLTVVSSAPGEQGYVTGKEADALTTARSASPTAVVLDPSGEIGHAYGAKTTPHMFVIDPAGMLVYMGAIDDQPRNFGADPARANNYVRTALAAVKSGQPVANAITQPYGCSVKYAK